MKKLQKFQAGQTNDTIYDQGHRTEYNLQHSISLPKTHAHIMLTQLNIKDGLKAYSNKGDEAILKEVQQ